MEKITEIERKDYIVNELSMVLNKFCEFDENVDMFDYNEYTKKKILKPMVESKRIIEEHKKIMEFISKSYERIAMLEK